MTPRQKKEREAGFKKLYKAAFAAGLKAGKDAVPAPMIIGDADIMGRPRPGGKQYYVNEGVCGFGWIEIRPGNSPLANWLKKQKLATKSYMGGVRIGTPMELGQSLERNAAYAHAFAKVLYEAGFRAWGRSRID